MTTHLGLQVCLKQMLLIKALDKNIFNAEDLATCFLLVSQVSAGNIPEERHFAHPVERESRWVS